MNGTKLGSWEACSGKHPRAGSTSDRRTLSPWNDWNWKPAPENVSRTDEVPSHTYCTHKKILPHVHDTIWPLLTRGDTDSRTTQLTICSANEADAKAGEEVGQVRRADPTVSLLLQRRGGMYPLRRGAMHLLSAHIHLELGLRLHARAVTSAAEGEDLEELTAAWREHIECLRDRRSHT